ncbi:FimV/HubP family polar landmark protein [Pseudomonas sp. NPDC087346]|uniref:FimV/HubP family polar landmark protein n=1 Tax=Pseudomonas sp. NPDC087346 TaxID=3364438 RepID=UPI00381A9AAA
MLASRHVVLRGCAKWLLVAGVLSYSSWSLALGLGDITIHSALNQPLKADIALVDVGGLSESELSVSLATPDEFGRAGVERVFFLNDLKFTPILRGSSQLIRVTSSKPVNEPFLNFLVQLNQPNGRLLREYTVLIDPPGSPGIVPSTVEPDPRPQSSGFPSVEPAAPVTAAQGKRDSAPAAPKPSPVATSVNDALAEQLAASVLANQQMQKTIDELNAKVREQQTLIADGKKQASDLQERLMELQKAPPAISPPVPTPGAAPVEASDEGPNWPLLGGFLVLMGLLATGFWLRRQRQQAQDETLPVLPLANESTTDEPQTADATSSSAVAMHRDEPTNGDVLEAVGIYLAYGRLGEALGLLRDALHKEPERIDLGLQLLEVLGRQGASGAFDEQESHLRNLGVDEQQLRDIRARHPKLVTAVPVLPIAPAAAVTAVQPAADTDFELNLDQLSMDSSWDLEDSKPASAESAADVSALGSSLEVLPVDFELPETPTAESAQESELEWIADAETPLLDDDFLNEFGDLGQTLELAPLASDPVDEANAGKLEQAQTCIDDGDIDSAIALLNELLKDGDEPLRQTARTLLAGIR